MEFDILITAAVLVLGVLAVPYVIGPIVVHRTFRVRMPPEVIDIDPQLEPLPQQVQQFFDRTGAKLAENGFRQVATIALPTIVSSVQTIFALHAKQSTSEMAMAAIIVAKGTTAAKTQY